MALSRKDYFIIVATYFCYQAISIRYDIRGKVASFIGDQHVDGGSQGSNISISRDK